MTPEQQRIAIARVCGWTQPEGDFWRDPEGHDWRVMHGWQTYKDGTDILPDYLNDLNAMAEAESLIRNARAQMIFVSEVLMAMGFDNLIEAPDLNVDYCWHAMRSTAAQRAEAFLKTLGLWEETL